MKVSRWFTQAIALVVVGAIVPAASAAIVVIDDFNTNEGHFAQAPTFSGSTTGIATTSTADQVTTDSYEGAGSEQLVLLDNTTPGGTSRVRFLSGGGSAANNTTIPVTAGVDGWIGFALKTTTPGWDVQIWIEGPENNGSFQKPVIADGRWHRYEWNLDDETGGTDGWQATGVPGIVAGDIDVQTGNYTIDSILFRHANTPASSTILLDFVARNTEGSPIPEPATFVLAGLSLVGCIAARRRAA
jgi:hypothetical protein